MLKNRFMTAFAFAGLIGAAACAPEEEEVQFDDATLEEPATAPAIEPTPVTGDTMTMPPMTDTTTVGTETDSVTM